MSEHLMKAMEIERLYQEHRLNDEEPFHLVDKITELGYKSLNEYFVEKRDYEFSQISFEYLEKAPSECIAEVLRIINEKVTGVLFVDTDHPFIFCGNGSDYDVEYCDENGIPVYPIFTNGGCIVSQSGDFSFGVCLPQGVRVDSNYILRNVSHILRKYIDDVVVSGNDILIENRKVLGSANYIQNGMFMFVAHVSFMDSSELIQHICKKPMIKEVGYIECIERDKFKREVLQWLQKL